MRKNTLQDELILSKTISNMLRKAKSTYPVDPLTGLPTRIYYDAELREALIRAKQSGHSVAIVFLDLDGLKIVNHTFGHAMGDLLLQQVAKRLDGCVNSKGVLARLGGDEFLIFREIRHPDEAEALAHKIIDALHLSFNCEDEDLHVITHVGVSLFPKDGERLETLLRNADTALYRAKEEGKNNYQIYTPEMSTEAEKRVILENSFRRALKRKEFVVYYQPQIDLQSGKIVGMEALVRWQNPEFGLVPPMDFIPIAERTGLILPMGEWVLHEACAQTKAWQKAGLPRMCVAVNLSARQFQQQDMLRMIAKTLQDTRLEPECLELEITESYAMQNADFTISVLRDLKKMGVRVSIDDFGTGYSSLSYLKQFPIDTLKIDRSFVRDLSAVTVVERAQESTPMSKSLRVLIVASTEEDANSLLQELRTGGYDPTFERVETRTEMAAALARQSWEMVISDHSMPRFNATMVLTLLKKTGHDIPCIIVSNTLGEEHAVAALKMGAHDYLLKGNISRLVAAVERELLEAELRRERKRVEATVQRQASHDVLTDLPNRTLFKDRLTLALAHANRYRNMLAVLFVDLDRFKNIIDTLGPAVGDRLLQGVAERLASCLDEGDTLARLGGDEFVVLLPRLQRADKAVKLAQRVLEVLKPVFVFNGHELHITTSIGISLYPYDGTDVDTLLKNADTALYRAKEQGRNNYQLYTPAMNARAFERLAMENSLRKALERQQFLLHYQPMVDVAQGQIVGAEALVRWQHPDLGLVYPAEFIPLAEETGLIVPLGEWVLRAACAQTQAWHKAGYPNLTVAVNLSARQFQHQGLMDTIARVLRETELDPRTLELEITESIAMQNADFTNVILRHLKDMGVRIAMDDFGTGYSSLSYLRKFPIDTLKIDQSFVRDLTTDLNDAAIANAIIVLAHSLKLKVIAEGVETAEQEAFLKAHHCDKFQGYLFSRPLTAVQFEQLLFQGRGTSISLSI